jgi:L-lactate dehydrogenase complex protein LldG
MTDAREAVLGRIWSGLAEANAGGSAQLGAGFAQIPRNYDRRGGLDSHTRLHLFVERLHDYDANVVETTGDSVPDAIAAVLTSHGQGKVIVADGLPAEFLPQDFDFLPEREAGIEDLNECDGIVTVCTVAIASTGTIVLTHGRGEGKRRLTLLPDRHLCIVRAEQIVETVPEAFDRLAPLATHPLTFISGPSATADIEMTRIRGVHGPRFLDVVLVG